MPDNEGMALLTSTGMSRAGGCLSSVALAALAACGGGQSTDASGEGSGSPLGDKFVAHKRGGRWGPDGKPPDALASSTSTSTALHLHLHHAPAQHRRR
jgi:hypothetical protein